ncbi:MAG: general secretion pathway protein GspK [Candidatus Magnetoovum sp. WYHC-5]|nr:general secretion pathway protein GspK [Candidatus Magnetoovum sp. WYHC-5]
MWNNKSGSAVLLSIFLSAIIITVAIGFNWLVKEHVKTAIGFKNKSRAMVKVYSAIDTLTYVILTGRKTADGIEFSDRSLLGISGIGANNRPLTVWKEVEISVQDTNGMVSLYNLDVGLFENLMKVIKIANYKEISDSVSDWVDSDNIEKAQGAENNYYTSMNKEYWPRNKNVEYLEELLLIRGMNRQIFGQLEPYLTTMPSTGFNPKAASDELMMAFFKIDRKTMLKYRTSPCATIRSVFNIDAEDEAVEFCTMSGNLVLTVRYGDGAGNSLYSVNMGIGLIETNLYPYQIYYWKEG